jgi:Ser/Thr protein kinase RdoA (MazF antagonist)
MTYPDIRVVHSIVDQDHLADLLQERYDVGEHAYCELIHRGMNDIYKVSNGRSLWACRVWRTGWRSLADVEYELAFLDHLHNKGISVANPIRSSESLFSFVVQAPEGIRSVALFEWARGHKFGDQPTEQHAFEIGALFARMHLAGADFKPNTIRRTNRPSDYLDNLRFLRRLVADRPGDIELYETIAHNLYDKVTGLEARELPFGPGHGDFHFNNVHVDDDDNIMLLDFDNGGEDYLLQDVACYVWANHYGKLDNVYATTFVDGYDSVRPFTEDEKDLLDLFVMAKEFRLISGFAKNVNQIGHYPLRFRSLDWFSQSLRNRAEALGLI